jgi:sugar lactone lactonase YvrE
MHKLFLILLAVACTLVAASASAAEVEAIVLFNPAVLETPESIQVDRHGYIYISFARLGEIRKIALDGTQSTLALLPIHLEIQPCPVAPGRSAGIALDHQGNVYVNVISCSAADLGIWKVTPDGQQQQGANLPEASRPNGIAYHDGWLYVADSALALVWRSHSDGQSPAEIWTADPLLEHPPGPPSGFPGPNGLQVFRNEVYVSVSTRQHVVAFRIKANGSASPGRVHVVLGVDDFAFDVKGNLYAMTQVSQTVVRVTPEGTTEVLLTSADELDGPSSGAFGVGHDRKNLYIANAAFPIFPGLDPRRPSVMRLHIGIPGKPRPCGPPRCRVSEGLTVESDCTPHWLSGVVCATFDPLTWREGCGGMPGENTGLIGQPTLGRALRLGGVIRGLLPDQAWVA